MIPLSYYLVLSGILFACGVTGFLIKRNIITIFMSIELMLNGVNSLRQLPGGLRVLPRPACAGDAAGCYRCWLPDSHLLRRLHVGRERLLPLLRLPEPFHVFHADADPGEQLPADVHWLGGRRT